MALTVAHYNTTAAAPKRRGGSITATTMKPQFKLSVPSLTPLRPDKPTVPREGLLMGDPGPDYDKHECRVSIIDYMLNIASETGQYRYMRNWRNQLVFENSPVEGPVKRKDNCTSVSESEGSETEPKSAGEQD